MFVRGVDSVALFAEISVISMSRVCGLDVIERTLDAKPELFLGTANATPCPMSIGASRPPAIVSVKWHWLVGRSSFRLHTPARKLPSATPNPNKSTVVRSFATITFQHQLLAETTKNSVTSEPPILFYLTGDL